MVATLQLEVARRLMAKPAQEDYGVLTLLVQIQYAPRDSFKIPAGCFFPAPDVDSACITLVRRDSALLPPQQLDEFSAIVKRGFSQRRKMMFKLLKEDWPAEKLQRAFDELHLPPQVRAEMVSLEQFVRLTQMLATDSPHG
jgi:16S rRNA (adenine1518-N6/adenine1519-N6)-dimethyltransferase